MGIKADNVIVEMEENNSIIQNAIIGIYNGNLSKSGNYKALIGLDLLEESNDTTSMKVSMQEH